MVVGEIAEATDLLVAGGGPGGYTAAIRAAQLGRKVTVVDMQGRQGLGGVCVHTGCIPSKALLQVTSDLYSLRNGAGRGLLSDHARFDFGAFQDWKQSIVEKIAGSIGRSFDQYQIDVIEGELRFNRVDQVIVSSPHGPPRYLRFRDAILATGSRPVGLPNLRVDGENILDAAGVLSLNELPRNVGIIGAGYIGVELGTALVKAGCNVIIVESADVVLAGMDAALSGIVQSQLLELGIDLHLASTVEAFDGECITIVSAAGETALKVDKLVSAVGRRPNTDALGLDVLGAKADIQGRLVVGSDRGLLPHVSAIGDITPGPALAHKAMAEGIVAAEALSGRRSSYNPTAVPLVVFSDPEVASAGLTAAEARGDGIEVQLLRMPYSAVGRSMTLGADNGFLQLVFDRDADVLIGVQIAGAHASELISEGVIAIEMMASLADLANAIHPHPTLGELFGELARVGLSRINHDQRNTQYETSRTQ